MSDLRDRIAAVLVSELRAQVQVSGGFFNEYENLDDDGEPTGHSRVAVDGSFDPDRLADAVIAELGLRYQLAPEGGPWTGHHRYLTDWKWEPTNE